MRVSVTESDAMLPAISLADPVDSTSAEGNEGRKGSAVVAQRSGTEGNQLPNFKGKLDVLVAGGFDYERFIFQAHAQALGVQDAFECWTRRDFRVALFNLTEIQRETALRCLFGRRDMA